MTSAVQDTEAAEKTALEEANQLEQDAYPEVNDLVQKYYDYMSAGDVDGLASVEDQISEEEQNRILRSKDLVEGYQNISCYTKKGLEDGSYLVFVYYELKSHRSIPRRRDFPRCMSTPTTRVIWLFSTARPAMS